MIQKQELEASYNSSTTEVVQQESDLSAVMKVLNDDKIESTGMSSMDMKARLQGVESSFILVHDVVVAMGCLPTTCLHTTRQRKRLSVSFMGLGRREIVEVVQSKNEREEMGGGKGFLNKLGGFFKPNTNG